jgi:hypothetical protein
MYKRVRSFFEKFSEKYQDCSRNVFSKAGAKKREKHFLKWADARVVKGGGL